MYRWDTSHSMEFGPPSLHLVGRKKFITMSVTKQRSITRLIM